MHSPVYLSNIVINLWWGQIGVQVGTGNSSEPASQDLTMLDLLALTSFFNVYAVCKSGLNTMRGKAGRTAYEGWELFE